jgi:Tol biopolymer transport system component
VGRRTIRVSQSIATAMAVACTAGCIGSGEATEEPPRAQNGMLPIVQGDPIDVSELAGKIVFDDYEDVYVMDADGTDIRSVARRSGPEFDGAWSPDGMRIVYRDSRRGINEDDEVFIVGADGKTPTNLTRNPANDWGPDWSPDGRTVVFNSDRDGGVLRGYLVAADGSNLRPIETDVWFEYPAFSPDGTKLAFMAHDGADYNIYVLDVTTGATERLTDAPGDDGYPAWSPDGSMIAFSSERDDCLNVPATSPCWRDPEGEPGEYSDTWIMDADGSHERRVTPEFGLFMTWAPDGSCLLVSGVSLYVIRPDGTGRVDVLARSGGLPDWIVP